jgi:hypothetical protein
MMELLTKDSRGIWPSVVGRDSSVGIATRRVLDGSGIESRWEGGGVKFSASVQNSPGPTQSPIQWVPISFPGLKRPGRVVDHLPPHSAPRLKK